MKALVLSSDDIQNFSKLIYDPKAAAQLANSAGGVAAAAAAAARANVVNNNTTSLTTDSNNLMALQYYLKHPGNYVSSTTPAPHTMQKQQQSVAAAAVVAHAAHQQLLAQSQTQLKQLQLKQPTIHQQHQHGSYHHHPYYSQQIPSAQTQQTHLGAHTHHSHHSQQQQQQQHQHQQQQQQPQQHHQQHHHHSQQQQQQQQHHQQQHHQQHSHHNSHSQSTHLPVHALNQNSNFSAASSSTGGGTTTTSSHAPTQQSNSSSISPTARKTPATTHHTSAAAAAATSAAALLRTNASNNANATNSNNNNNNTSTIAAAGGTATTSSTSATSTAANCAKKIKTEPILSAYNQTERLNFANTHIGWSEDHWKRVIFQDERKFNLDGPDGFSYYFHDLRNYERMLSQRPRGNSVYIYLLVTVGGPIHLEVSTTKLKPETCIETILRERPNIISKLGGHTDLILQDHNWLSIALPSAQEWLNAEGMKTQKWPTVAHDLNIMENVWGWLIREVFDGGRKFSRKDDLIFRIREAWARLPIDLITNLYTTLPERITELYYTRGIYTNC